MGRVKATPDERLAEEAYLAGWAACRHAAEATTGGLVLPLTAHTWDDESFAAWWENRTENADADA